MPLPQPLRLISLLPVLALAGCASCCWVHPDSPDADRVATDIDGCRNEAITLTPAHRTELTPIPVLDSGGFSIMTAVTVDPERELLFQKCMDELGYQWAVPKEAR